MSIVEDLLPFMPRVQVADRDLHDLRLLWQMIEAASSISCPQEVDGILPTLVQTRVRFEELQERLVRQLGDETLAALSDELTSAAQCTIDILVRNLFERTADVGFLATDDVLRGFCAAPAAQQGSERAALVQRLAEYRAKYTVYDDIIVAAPGGQVLARLDDAGSALQTTADAIVALAAARPGYVERWAASDLAAAGADGGAALLYAHRIDDGAGRCIGVLVLRFRSGDELQRIFSSVAAAQRPLALALVDGAGAVLASNDLAQLALGARLPAAASAQVALVVLGGREYLSVNCGARGYQGYGGPGWRAQVLLSLETAFRGRPAAERQDGALPPVVLDSAELQQTQSDVDAINRNLRRVVWNGHLVAGKRGSEHGGDGDLARLKAVLEQVSAAGTRTRNRVASAIAELVRTTLGRTQQQAQQMARLAADIMDRNLYERANDCRWWALSPVLQRVLAEPAGAAGSDTLNALLAHINGLYTVYSRLAVFDAQGTVRGVSNDAAAGSLLGTVVDPALLSAVVALTDSQRYAVSPFAASALSDGMPTYVYLAAVRHGGRVVGGIAIVFNAEREFRAILEDVLGQRAGLAAFVDADNRVVSSTDAALPVGSVLPLDARQPIAEQGGAHLSVAAAATSGYREFKSSDGYQNHVRAVVALRLGATERRRVALSDAALRAMPAAPKAACSDFALFQTGAARYAVLASAVLEARPVQGLLRTPGSAAHALGLLDVSVAGASNVVPVFCARGLLGADGDPRPSDGVVLVLAAPWDRRRPLLGLRVDDVISVVQAGPDHLQRASAGLRAHAPLLTGLLRLRSAVPAAEVLVQVIDGEALAATLGCSAPDVRQAAIA